MKTSAVSASDGLRRWFTLAMVLAGNAIVASIDLGSVGLRTAIAQDSSNISWKSIPDMAQKRWEAGKVVLDDMLYLFGGYTDGPTSIKHVDVFDPKDNSWKQLKDLPSAITHFNAVLDGRTVWFAGGFKDGYPGKAISEVWNYDIDKDAYTAAPSLPESRAAGGLALVGRHLHYIGGLLPDRDTDSPDHWMFDLTNPDAGWNTRAPMPAPRHPFGTVTFEGKIYTMAGQFHHDSGQLDQPRVDIYDPEADSWSTGPALPHGHSHAEGSTFIHGGRIYIIGGHATPEGGRKRIDDDILALTPGGQWKVVGKLPTPLSSPAAAIIGDQLYVGGGSPNGSAVQARMWVGDAP